VGRRSKGTKREKGKGPQQRSSEGVGEKRKIFSTGSVKRHKTGTRRVIAGSGRKKGRIDSPQEGGITWAIFLGVLEIRGNRGSRSA